MSPSVFDSWLFGVEVTESDISPRRSSMIASRLLFSDIELVHLVLHRGVVCLVHVNLRLVLSILEEC